MTAPWWRENYDAQLYLNQAIYLVYESIPYDMRVRPFRVDDIMLEQAWAIVNGLAEWPKI